MNDPLVKIALALSILVGGILTAIAFRPESNATKSTAPSWAELASLRSRRLTADNLRLESKGSGESVSLRPCEDNPAAAAPPTVLAPLDNPPPVPSLSSKYPGDRESSTTGWGMPLALPTETNSLGKGSRVHKIVDGDTLAALAAKYLGSANRAMEIFTANRDVLNDPELLPIGVELTIP